MHKPLWILRAVSILLTLSVSARGQFAPAAGSPFLVGGDPQSVITGDFNGDGIPDLAIADGDGTVIILVGNGTGGFTPTLNSPFVAGDDLVSAAVGGFNGDGKLDLAITNSVFGGGGSGSVIVLLGDGASSAKRVTLKS